MKSNASILLVDDQVELLNAIKRVLEHDGYQVLTAENGIEALAILEQENIDLILADIAMPNMNGYQLYKRVIQNSHWVVIPFVFLSGRGMDSDIRYGKELGVDDYLIKPIATEDLLAVVRGRLRRARQMASSLSLPPAPSPAGETTIWTLGQLQIAPEQHRVWKNGKPVKLSAKEFQLLKRLAQHPNNVLSLEDLLQATHGLETNYADAGVLLRPLIRSLRRKLGYPAGEMGCIESVRGAGYKLLV